MQNLTNPPMPGNLRILMVAAENDALPGGKVGGIGDVVRDSAPALAARGCEVTVLTPAYGVFAELAGAKALTSVTPLFGYARERVDLYEVPGRRPRAGVRYVVADHPLFAACGPGRIYCHDPPGAPFATDANKFALFCVAVTEALVGGALAPPDVVHLHDWHAGLVLALRHFHPDYTALGGLRMVYTIHNLALQGIRPLSGHTSSLASWYPGLVFERRLIADPRWSDCVNPMAVGIRLADAVHTVSPTYAREVLEPSAVAERGYYGGEGLEGDLREARAQGRLFGILNGCEYPEESPPPPPPWAELVPLMQRELLGWAARQPVLSAADFIADKRLQAWAGRTPSAVLTSVSRVTEQKMRLLQERDGGGRPALEGVLEALGENGVYVFLGTGEPIYEQFLAGVSARFDNFLFLRGYSDAVSTALYAAGDLFVMPSSFEPCGISQMLAMRAAQPCLVHGVGGLKDTVEGGVNGFAFDGAGFSGQADALVAAARSALALRRDDPPRWARIREAAAAARFRWQDTVDAYIAQLYRPPAAPARSAGKARSAHAARKPRAGGRSRKATGAP